jgi:hypothetical protein
MTPMPPGPPRDVKGSSKAVVSFTRCAPPPTTIGRVNVGDLVKPVRAGTWRLGYVESIADDGRCVVRAFVAPSGAYEGSVATYSPVELAVVPLETVIARLFTVRAEAAAATQIARQITEALSAVEQSVERCKCGGSAGQHNDGCVLVQAIG